MPRRALLPVGAVALLLVLALGAWSVPSVRTVLRQSFTRIPTPYTELYFTSPPVIDGNAVTVPVTVTDHGTGTAVYQVRVELETDRGKVLRSATAPLKPRDGVAVPIVLHLSSAGGMTVVKVTLPGHAESLHYRIAAFPVPPTSPATPTPTPTPSAGATRSTP